MADRHTVTVTVNGTSYSREIEPTLLLVEFLRETLALTGTHVGCDTSQCGACTVLVDGRPVYSCMTLAVACEGMAIETIEGIAKDGELHPVQRAFIDADAFQCGFCTPGQIMSIVALLRENAGPNEDDVRRAVAGIETYVWLTDVAGLSRPEAVELMCWSARTLR